MNNYNMYMYMKNTTTTTTTTIISRGGDPLRPAWGHPTEGRSLRASPEHISSLQFGVGPLPASRPTSSGRFMCMALPPTDDVRHRKLGCSRQHSEVRFERLLRMMLATPNGCPTVPFGVSWAFLAVGAATRRPKCSQGTERGRAPNVTHSAVWRTRFSETSQITIYFEHSIMERKWSGK